MPLFRFVLLPRTPPPPPTIGEYPVPLRELIVDVSNRASVAPPLPYKIVRSIDEPTLEAPSLRLLSKPGERETRALSLEHIRACGPLGAGGKEETQTDRCLNLVCHCLAKKLLSLRCGEVRQRTRVPDGM